MATTAIELTPLETLMDTAAGPEVALPPELRRLYGPLRLPSCSDRPYVISNFVSTLDGVVSLNTPGYTGGAPISGYSVHDHVVMGILRALADAVIVGAGTLRGSQHHLWTAEHIYPPLAEPYAELRSARGEPPEPLNVVVTASGALDLELPVFQSGCVPVLIVTSERGAAGLRGERLPEWVRVAVAGPMGPFDASGILQSLGLDRNAVVLVEGGPRLLGDFLSAGLIDEQFLTLAPQIAGRDSTIDRPGLVAGTLFAPSRQLWAELVSVKRGGSHLFLRYALPHKHD